MFEIKFTFTMFNLIEIKFTRDSNHCLAFEVPIYYFKDEDETFDATTLNESVWHQCEHLLGLYRNFKMEAFGNIKLFPDGGSHVYYRIIKNN